MSTQIMSRLEFHSDFLFLSKETIRMMNDQEQEVVQTIEVLTGFDFERGFPKQVNLEAIQESVTASCLDK